MSRLSVIIMVLILLPLATVVSSASASQLIDGGQTDVLDYSAVFWGQDDSGLVLTVDSDGMVRAYTMVQGQHVVQWSQDLNISVNSATLHDSQSVLGIAHDNGVQVFNYDLQTVTRNILSGNPVDQMDWDDENAVWMAYYAGSRKIIKVDSTGQQDLATPAVSAGISHFTILGDGTVVSAGYDKKLRVYDEGAAVNHTFSNVSGFINCMEIDNLGRLLVGTTNGEVVRYNTETWVSEILNLPSSGSITTLSAFSSSYGAGMQNGKFNIINLDMTHRATLQSQGLGIESVETSEGAVYFITTTSSTTKVQLFDVDSDGDGYADAGDAFPAEPTQWEDADSDGRGDNPDGVDADLFPDNPEQWSDFDSDGYGDNSGAEGGDAFPTDPGQWEDSDADGYGDNSANANGDYFPNEPTQWKDSDGDGFGDNPLGVNGDACPAQNGFSSRDRLGCPDSDLDGWSDPDQSWTVEDGGDALPNLASQWSDADSDGYGDNVDGFQPDMCPWQAGTSQRTLVENVTEAGVFQVFPSFGCEDLDGDGWVDVTESQGMDEDPNEHLDKDGDGVGENSDYDDNNSLVQTEQDHCNLNFDDNRTVCQAWRNAEYQSFLSTLNQSERENMSYNQFLKQQEQSGNPFGGGNGISTQAINDALVVGGGAFGILTLIIVVIGLISSKSKKSKNMKVYGNVEGKETMNASQEALQGIGGLSASGGVDSSSDLWDDDVPEFKAQPDGFDDIDLQTGNVSEQSSADDLYTDSDSMEDLAGIPKSEPTSNSVSEAQQAPAEVPPLPEGGLPEGWTMDQWKWYGQQWLDSQK